MNFSYWERQFIADTADLTIVGSGITGMSAAYHASIRFPNWKIIVLDKLPLSNAASTRNAGFACFGSGGELLDDLNSGMSESEVFLLAEKRYQGLLKLREILGDKQLDFIECGSMELFDENQEKEFHQVLKKLDVFNSSISDFSAESRAFSECKTPTQLSGFKYAIHNSLEGKLNPGKMMNSWRDLCISKGIKFYRGAAAKLCPENKGVFFGNHFIHSSQVCLCTNGMTNELALNLDVQPARNLILLSKPVPHLELPSTYHHDKGYVYFRIIHDRLLIGGGRNKFMKQESTSEFSVNQDLKSYLTQYIEDRFSQQNIVIDQEWTGIMGVAKSKKTIVNRISDNLTCAVRLGGMGVAIGTLVGKEVSDLL